MVRELAITSIRKDAVTIKVFLLTLVFLLCSMGYLQAKANQFIITIDVSKQKLFLFESVPFEDTKLVRMYPVSTSKYGVSNEKSGKGTPLGTHFIAEKIGEGAQVGTVFKSRQNIGEIAKIYTDTKDTPEDLITTRILWLGGIEPGINEGEKVDSYTRYIYIHGTPEEGLIGTPASNGCIRMKNSDIAELFDLVSQGTLVAIHE